jgi:hypothetical protein
MLLGRWATVLILARLRFARIFGNLNSRWPEAGLHFKQLQPDEEDRHIDREGQVGEIHAQGVVARCCCSYRARCEGGTTANGCD